jgi:hypothetical protein
MKKLVGTEKVVVVVEKENSSTLKQLAEKFNTSSEEVKKIIEKGKKVGTAKNVLRSGLPRATSIREDR